MSVDYAEAARLIKAGRRAEKRGTALKGCLSALLQKVCSDLLTGWFLMLAVGIAHAEWVHRFPTIGFWWAVVLTALLRPMFGGSGPKSEAKK